ncbi:hypothetical protein AGLY_018178 [Aphis glycines]|uniref:Uncharacterized protein n=1 Tax=Aphis glycines TaxID=307491 RepID=A0A6G0STK3_APHGL|nr:hypothetical protein AGLY_018178 [Aphis glycines]
MFTFNGYKHQGHSICSRKPPSKFVIGAFFRLVMLFAGFRSFFFCLSQLFWKTVGNVQTFLTVISIRTFDLQSKNHLKRFGRIPVLCKICRFRSIFFLFISIIMKTVGKCSLLTVISIKDIRFAVETHPQNIRLCSRRTTLKFVSEHSFGLVMLYKEKKKKKIQKSINNSKNTYLFENSTIHR